MNLKTLSEAQAKLDERIMKEKGLEGRGLLTEKILALQVELGELANEWRGFKFWSEDQEPRNKVERMKDCEHCKGVGYFPSDNEITEEICVVCKGLGQFLVGYKNPLLEEYVDCLHFILSIGLEVSDAIYDMDDYEIYIEEEGKISLTEQFIFTNWIVGSLIENQAHYEQALFSVLELGELLGFTWKQIEQAYYDKNKVNHARQNNGY